MAKKSHVRRIERRAADRDQVKADPGPPTRGCIECGRGEINAALLPPPLDTINTKLKIVACPDLVAHTPPFGRHIGRCRGFVWQHENPRICMIVKSRGQAAKTIAAGGN